MLKKFVLIVAVLLSLLLSCGKIAHADTDKWARIVDDDVYFYTSEDAKQELFVLQKSYYVNIVAETDNMYQIAVMPQASNDFVQIIGWAYKRDLTLCSTQPIDPVYPTVKLTVTADSVDLKLSPVPSSQTSCAILNLQEIYYYGAITSYGRQWYYVRYAGRFGYVEASAVSELNIKLHPTPLPQKPASTTPTTPSTDTTPDTKESSSPASEILLIVFVVVLAAGLTLALFLPGNFKKKNNVFEQDI